MAHFTSGEITTVSCNCIARHCQFQTFNNRMSKNVFWLLYMCVDYWIVVTSQLRVSAQP